MTMVPLHIRCWYAPSYSAQVDCLLHIPPPLVPVQGRVLDRGTGAGGSLHLVVHPSDPRRDLHAGTCFDFKSSGSKYATTW